MIPGQATAKVSFRLVGAQDPKKIRDAFHAFIEARLPADAKAEFKSFASAPATELPFDNPALAKTRAALAAEWGRKATVGEGGSIPIVGDFKRVLGMDTIMVGRADDDRCIRRTRSTTSRPSTRARAAGHGFWRRWRHKEDKLAGRSGA